MTLALRLPCPWCGGRGFLPVRRAHLWVGPLHRPQELRYCILYVPCPHCQPAVGDEAPAPAAGPAAA